MKGSDYSLLKGKNAVTYNYLCKCFTESLRQCRYLLPFTKVVEECNFFPDLINMRKMFNLFIALKNFPLLFFVTYVKAMETQNQGGNSG